MGFRARTVSTIAALNPKSLRSPSEYPDSPVPLHQYSTVSVVMQRNYPLNSEALGSLDRPETLTHRVLGTVMGHTSPNHNRYFYSRNPTFCYTGTLDPLGFKP